MGYYMIFMGGFLIILSLYLLIHRLVFRRRATKVTGGVVEKVIRNSSAENQSGRSRLLKVSFTHLDDEISFYETDNSLITPFYKVGSNFTLLLDSRDSKHILIDAPLSLYSPSLIIFIMGFVILMNVN